MNKTILKILISTLILLIGIGAVSAIEHNSTDEFFSVEKTDEISIIENNTEVISVDENNTEVLSVENNNSEVISVDENNTEVLSVENNNSEVISVSNDDLITYSPFAIEPQGTQSQTQYKTLYVGKMKFSKKYKRWVLYGYKIPSKKNKKAWKKHKAYQKAYKKQLKQFKKTAKKVVIRASANHWHYGTMYYKIKYSGKYMYILYYVGCYRTYNYNPLLNKGWWD